MTPLIILHGAIGASDQFLPLAEKLAHEFDVYLFEFSGHGQTPVSKQGFSIPVFANELAGFIEHNFKTAVPVFGYSMGGYVGLYLALHRAGLISQLCTLGTKWKWSESIAQRESGMLNPEKIQEKIPAFAKTLENRHTAAGWKNLLSLTAGMMKEMGSNNPLSPGQLARVETTVQLMLGEEDEMVSHDETEEIYRKLRNANYVQLPGTRHPIEKADVTMLAHELVSFFKS